MPDTPGLTAALHQWELHQRNATHDWVLWQTNFTRGTYTYRCLGCPAEDEKTVPYAPLLREARPTKGQRDRPATRQEDGIVLAAPQEAPP